MEPCPQNPNAFLLNASLRGRTKSTEVSEFKRYSFPEGLVKLIVPETASRKFTCPSIITDPRGTGGIFEVSHVGICAGVKRINNHFTIYRARDFNAPISEGRGYLGDFPLRLANTLPSRSESQGNSPLSNFFWRSAASAQQRVNISVKLRWTAHSKSPLHLASRWTHKYPRAQQASLRSHPILCLTCPYSLTQRQRKNIAIPALLN